MKKIDSFSKISDSFNAAVSFVDANVIEEARDRVAIFYQALKISYRDLQSEMNRVGGTF